MYYDSSDLSESLESSPKTSTDTASNWSRPVRKKKSTYSIGTMSRRTTRLKTNKIYKSNKRAHERSKCENSNGLRMSLRRFKLKMRRLPKLNIKQTKAFIEKINDQSRLVCYLWPRCQQQTVELEAELSRFQQRLRELQSEEMEIKRKQWCRVCQEEATYLRQKRFYCSAECEMKFNLLQEQGS